MPLTRDDFPDVFEPIYTFVERETGKNVHIASTRLRNWCLEHRGELEVTAVPVDTRLAGEFLEKNAVLEKRAKELFTTLPRDMEQWEPIIYALDGTFHEGRPNVMLVDGHHRYFCAAVAHSAFILAWVLKPEQWEPFKIEGIHEYSEQELVNEPIISKPHWNRGEGVLEIHLRAGSPIEMLEKLLGVKDIGEDK